MAVDDYDGLDVLGPDGDKIGRVERTYIDDRGVAHVVAVKLGALFATHHRLVPTDKAEVTEAGLQVPYTKLTVENSPEVPDVTDSLDSDVLAQVSSYYTDTSSDEDGDSEDAPGAVPAAEADRPDGEDGEGLGDRLQGMAQRVGDRLTDQDGGADGRVETDPATAGAEDLGRVRDLGDVIEVPIVEEEVVKRPVVREVLRVRKSTVAETQPVGADVRREDVEVERAGDTTGGVDDS